MILKYLFAQYDDRRGPIFASRLMTRLGETFMGSVEAKGLGHIREDLKRTYYDTADDRRMPSGGADLDEWQKQSILLTQYRQIEHKQVAKATSIFVLVASLALVAGASPFNGSLKRTLELDEGGRVSQWMGRVFSSSESSSSGATFAECQELRAEVARGGSALVVDADLERKWSECQLLMEQAARSGGTN